MDDVPSTKQSRSRYRTSIPMTLMPSMFCGLRGDRMNALERRGLELDIPPRRIRRYRCESTGVHMRCTRMFGGAMSTCGWPARDAHRTWRVVRAYSREIFQFPNDSHVLPSKRGRPSRGCGAQRSGRVLVRNRRSTLIKVAANLWAPRAANLRVARIGACLPPPPTKHLFPRLDCHQVSAMKTFSASSIDDPNVCLLQHMLRKLATNTCLKGLQAIKVVHCARGDPSSSTGDPLCLLCSSYYLLNQRLLFSD